jgi:hypothetical protein
VLVDDIGPVKARQQLELVREDMHRRQANGTLTSAAREQCEWDIEDLQAIIDNAEGK